MLQIISQLTPAEQIIYGLLLLTTLYQVFVWVGFSAIATHRHFGRLKKGDELPAVSIVVLIQEGQEWYVEDGLDRLLTQQYEGKWEVIVVNDCSGSELTDALASKAGLYHHLRHTELKLDVRFPHSRKIPLLVGIKAANMPNIIIADPTAAPSSDKWLSIMARGFVGAHAVIGYTGFENGTNGLIRASRFFSSLRSLRAAIAGRPYKGIFNNIGYSKEIFFESRGYTHLRLALGEDDLFIQKIAKQTDISVMLNPHCTMRQHAYGGVRWWWRNQRYQSYSFRYYPATIKFRIAMELIMRTLFFASVGATAIASWQWSWTIGAGALVVRELILIWSATRVMRRVGEKKLIWSLMLYDLIAPLTETALAISRRAKVSKEVWK